MTTGMIPRMILVLSTSDRCARPTPCMCVYLLHHNTSSSHTAFAVPYAAPRFENTRATAAPMAPKKYAVSLHNGASDILKRGLCCCCVVTNWSIMGFGALQKKHDYTQHSHKTWTAAGGKREYSVCEECLTDRIGPEHPRRRAGRKRRLCPQPVWTAYATCALV